LLFTINPYLPLTMFRMRSMMKRTVPIVTVSALMTLKVAACEDIFHSLVENHFHWKPNMPLTSANVIEGN